MIKPRAILLKLSKGKTGEGNGRRSKKLGTGNEGRYANAFETCPVRGAKKAVW